MKNLSLLLLFLIATVSYTFGQKENKDSPALSMAIFNENFGLNAFPQGNPLHTGGTIAVAFTKKQNSVYRKKHTIELGYFKHAPIFQATYLAWKPTYQWQFNNGFLLHSIVGLGYLHALPTQTTFIQENGNYIAKNNTGKSGGMGTLGVGLGYQVAQDSSMPITLFVRQEWMLIAPFNINKSFPGSLNALLSIGITVHPF